MVVCAQAVNHCAYQGGLFEQAQLIGMWAARNAAMGAGVDTVQDGRIARLQLFQRLGAAAGKACALPDLVETAWIAVIAGEDLLARGSQPAREPNVDRIGFGEWTMRKNRWRAVKEGEGHGFNRTMA